MDEQVVLLDVPVLGVQVVGLEVPVLSGLVHVALYFRRKFFQPAAAEHP